MRRLTKLKAFFLHHANRSIKDFAWGQYTGDFYRVKNMILKRYGKAIGYDIQHIEGKKCYTCDGSGLWNPDPCWSCAGSGWYKDPQWICLERISFGGYVFHFPMKREYGLKNPFTRECLGFDVSTNPVITGYIEHNETWIGRYAIAVIMYGTPDFKLIVKRILKEWKWYWQRRLYNLKKVFALRKKKVFAVNAVSDNEESDLPF